MTIENTKQYAPIRQALGAEWPKLGTAIRRHYDLPPNTDTQLEVEGTMDVVLSPIGKVFLLIGRLLDALVPFKGKDIPVTVRNWSTPDSRAMFWHRTFRYPGKNPIVFRSRMEYAGNNDIVEYVKFGLGMRMELSAEGETLRYDSLGYQWGFLRIPDWLLLGTAVIRETPISEQAFQVNFEINHPLWGRTFGYSGQFIFSK